MKTAQEISSEIKAIFSMTWQTRKGTVVPEAEDVKLDNDGVQLDAAVLYADMADSTGLVNGYKDWFAAEVYKAYLVAACHVLRNNDGAITAFDGDRVMAVFIGASRNSSAAKAALQLNWVVTEVNSILKLKYPNSAFQLKHSVGIDCSPILVAKTGIRRSNDLVWVGRAANYAAKLANIPDVGYSVFITETVYSLMSDETKHGGSPKKSMWEKAHWTAHNLTIYKSNWYWKP